MNNPSISNMTQKEFDVATLFLSKQADSEIDFNDNDVEGVIYICIGDEDNWLGLNFKASVTKVYTAGELWKDGWGVHCIDTATAEIDDIIDITVSYNDSNVGNIDYKSRINDIKNIVSDFISVQELSAPNKYDIYNV